MGPWYMFSLASLQHRYFQNSMSVGHKSQMTGPLALQPILAAVMFFFKSPLKIRGLSVNPVNILKEHDWINYNYPPKSRKSPPLGLFLYCWAEQRIAVPFLLYKRYPNMLQIRNPDMACLWMFVCIYWPASGTHVLLPTH